MARLKLDIGALEVQSFEVAKGEGARGTVRAHSVPYSEVCGTWEEACTAAYNCTDGYTAPWQECPSNGAVCPVLPPRRFTDQPCE